MDINFHITKEKFDSLTWDEWNALESAEQGEFKPKELMSIAVRFLADESNQPLDEKAARRNLGKLDTKDMGLALTKLSQAIIGYSVPKSTGNA